MRMAIGQGTSETYTFTTCKTYMTWLVEMKRTLTCRLAMCGLLYFEGSYQTGSRERVRLRGVFIGGSVRFFSLAPHFTLEILQSSVGASFLVSFYNNSKMETHQPQRYQLVDSFLHTIKQAQSKQQFLSKVHEFDSRFIEDHSAPSMPERQKSVQKLPPMPQEKPKNPFKTNVDDFRHQVMMHQTQQNPFAGQQPTRGAYKTQQNFYKQPSTSSIRGQPQYNQPSYGQPQNQYSQQNSPYQQHPMTGNYGYNQSRNLQSQNQQQGGMGVLNYNAFSQRQYDELKQQFFRPPNIARPPENYNRMNQGAFNEMAYNFGMNMGTSSSSEILPGQTSFSRPTPRNYPERVNPFMRQ